MINKKGEVTGLGDMKKLIITLIVIVVGIALVVILFKMSGKTINIIPGFG